MSTGLRACLAQAISGVRAKNSPPHWSLDHPRRTQCSRHSTSAVMSRTEPVGRAISRSGTGKQGSGLGPGPGRGGVSGIRGWVKKPSETGRAYSLTSSSARKAQSWELRLDQCTCTSDLKILARCKPLRGRLQTDRQADRPVESTRLHQNSQKRPQDLQRDVPSKSSWPLLHPLHRPPKRKVTKYFAVVSG